MNGQESCFNNEDEILGDFGVRTMHAKQVGYFIEKHVHNYGHLEEVISGSIRLVLTSKEFQDDRVLKVGEMAFIPANVFHTAVALEENTIVRCIFHVKNVEGKTELADLKEAT